ncbi:MULTISPECIES: restriction endonuclease [unclassified Streptomyces]|uniref:restriction endonuclease n=1 Tax=unclassified Streptomyces TaxID=2593676 RepID=UPI0036E9C000
MAVGAQVRRRDLHQQYGGSGQGGISSCKSAPYIFLFTDHTRGQQYGYFDGWGEDGLYHYCGEGQQGPQVMARGNKALLQHAQSGKSLQLLEYVATGVVALRGEFEVDEEQPYYISEAPDASGETRTVIMFRLRPISDPPVHEPQLAHTPAPDLTVQDIELEGYHTTLSATPASSEPSPAVRRESALVQEYGAFLRRRGHRVGRKRVYPAGELNALLTDLFDYTTHTLVEAKGNATRGAVRMAIGQLLDYRRFIEPTPTLAILTPQEPRKDLRDLCAALSINVIWPENGAFLGQEAEDTNSAN